VTTVLLAEDDSAIAEPLSRALQREGYQVEFATEGQQTLDVVEGGDIDLLVLDLGLPGMDGLEVCRRLRGNHPDLPVLMLTARTDEVDFVVGLDAGADDYVGKPFRLAELLARVRALLRRRAPDVLEIGGIRLEPAARRVLVDGTEVALANKEYELLRVLMQRAGQVVRRADILRDVWGDPNLRTSRTLDMHMSWLRRKIGDEQRIATVRGVGFRFNAS
jgi:DNA-binding response OmpR family regulator